MDVIFIWELVRWGRSRVFDNRGKALATWFNPSLCFSYHTSGLEWSKNDFAFLFGEVNKNSELGSFLLMNLSMNCLELKFIKLSSHSMTLLSWSLVIVWKRSRWMPSRPRLSNWNDFLWHTISYLKGEIVAYVSKDDEDSSILTKVVVWITNRFW